jgi:hypothetical protein
MESRRVFPGELQTQGPSEGRQARGDLTMGPSRRRFAGCKAPPICGSTRPQKCRVASDSGAPSPSVSPEPTSGKNVARSRRTSETVPAAYPNRCGAFSRYPLKSRRFQSSPSPHQMAPLMED